MFKKYLPWIVLGLIVIALIGIGIKMFNSIPDVNPYNMQINRLETELLIEKRKTDSLDQKVKYWEQLYIEESKKPKKIIQHTNENIEKIKLLSPDSNAAIFYSWSGLTPPTLGVQEDSLR